MTWIPPRKPMALVLFGLNYINNVPFLVNEVVVVLVDHHENVGDGPSGCVGVQDVEAAPESHDFVVTQLAV